jgi:hypothetical protein
MIKAVYLDMHVCMHACMYVCMHIHALVYTSIHVYIQALVYTYIPNESLNLAQDMIKAVSLDTSKATMKHSYQFMRNTYKSGWSLNPRIST